MLNELASTKDINQSNVFNPLSANPTKWPNTLKQFVGKLLTNCLSVFDQFVKLALKGLRVFSWFPLINIKAVYLIDDIFCKMHHDRFYMVLSFVFVPPSFLLFFIAWCFMVTKLLFRLHCLDTRCEPFNSLNFFSTVILYLVWYQLFIKCSTSKSLCYPKDLLQNQNNIVVILALVNKLVYWIMVLCL